MSAAMPRPTDLDHRDSGTNGHDDTVVAGTPVVVRRNAGLAALVGAGASAIAIAYLWRATQSAAPLDWALCLVMAAVAGMYLAHLVDARTPLLVADDLGVRIRLGNQWRGLPWDAVDRVVVQPRRGPFHDGRLMFAPHSLPRALDGLEPRGRRAATLNQKMYGAALAVPMGLTTRVSAHGQELADGLAALAHGRTDVVVVTPTPPPSRPGDPAPEPTADPATLAAEPAPRVADPAPLAAEPASRLADPATLAGRDPRPRGRRHRASGPAQPARRDRDDRVPGRQGPQPRPGRRSRRGRRGPVEDASDEQPEPERPVAPAARSAVPLRDTRPALRAQVTRDTPATVLGNAALHPDRYDAEGRRRTALPEGRELRRQGSVDLEFEAAPSASVFESGRVRPISTLGDAGRRAGHRRLRHRAGLRPGHRPRAGRGPRPGRPERRRPGRAHPDPPARHRVDRGRRLRAVRRRLLRPRPPAHAGAGAGQGPGAAAPAVRRPLRDRADQRPPGVRGRAGDRDDREHAQHGRRPQLGAAGRGRARPGDDLGRRAAVRGRAAGAAAEPDAGAERVGRHRLRRRQHGSRRRPRRPRPSRSGSRWSAPRPAPRASWSATARARSSGPARSCSARSAPSRPSRR